MLYKQLAEVSTYVSDKKHDLNEVLQLLCVKVLAGLNAGGVVFIELNRLGYVAPHSSFGFEADGLVGDAQTIHISDHTPFTDAIRENRVIVINTLPHWPKQYSQMAAYAFPKSFKSLVICPINIDGLPVGCLSTFTHSKIQLDNELTDFLEAITIIIAGWFRRDSNSEQPFDLDQNGFQGVQPYLNHSAANFADEEKDHLTDRQMLILKMISEGRTNAAIADVLGYSESLIRQETIKIYAKLHCSGRSEAALIYHSMSDIKQTQAV